MEDQTISAVELSRRAALSALGKKAEELIILDVRELVSYAQFFVICHGTNTRQVSAIAEAVRQDLRDELGEVPLGIVHCWFLDAPKVSKREQMITQMSFTSPAELQGMRENLETWSSLCLDGLPQISELGKTGTQSNVLSESS